LSDEAGVFPGLISSGPNEHQGPVSRKLAEAAMQKCPGLVALSQQLLNDDAGQDLVEYGVVALLIAVIAIVAIGTVGQRLNAGWQLIASSI
jgi:Flp pilus assembly pilin Flp